MSEYRWAYLNTENANPMFEMIAKAIQEVSAKTVLDIGCGHSRFQEFLTNSNVVVDGIDADEGCINYCKEHYKGNFVLGDAVNISSHEEFKKSYDCIVLSGLLYYFKEGMVDYVNKLVETYSPSFIIVAEPRPSITYRSPNFIPLLDRYAWVAKNVKMDIRMGDRVVYTLLTDKVRPERKIKASFNENSIHDHYKQHDFDDDRLKYGVYITNTEAIDSDRDGRLFPANVNEQYISVCAGFKGMYKACVDYTETGIMDSSFVYVDVVPAALDFRMYQDKMIADGVYDFNLIVKMYKKQINSEVQFHYGNEETDINKIIETQLEELDLKKYDWVPFLKQYAKLPKKYIKLDIVNNVMLLSKTIDRTKKTWFWYSNVFDWHQFRFSERSHLRWTTYLHKQIPTIQLEGKTPPFTSM